MNKRSGRPRLKGDRRWLEKMFEELFTENYSTFCKNRPTGSRHGENLNRTNPKKCVPTHIIVKCLETTDTVSGAGRGKHRLTYAVGLP